MQKRSPIKALSKVSLVSLTLGTHTVFLKKGRQFCCSGLLRRSKLVHSDGKSPACFTKNIVQNVIRVDLHCKYSIKYSKKPRAKIVQKNAYTFAANTNG